QAASSCFPPICGTARLPSMARTRARRSRSTRCRAPSADLTELLEGPLFLREDAGARGDLQAFRRAALELEHRGGGLRRFDRLERQRLGVVCDVNDLAAAVDEEHIERYIGVLHPHRDPLLRGIDE